MTRIATLATFLFISACASAGEPGTDPASRAGASPDASYTVYVGAESADLMHRIRFGPDGAAVEKTIPIGRLPTENEGPHGISISRDGRYLYLTTGHGVPTGKLWKYELGPDTLVAEEIGLGFFPATLDVTPDGLFAFVANFNLHGEHVPSSVSVIYTPDMIEVDRTETCVMPHGSRINPQGTRHYSACMMDDRIVEIDTRTFAVARQFDVTVGQEGPYMDHSTMHAEHMADGTHERHMAERAAGDSAGGMEHDMEAGGGMAHAPTCSPTWVEPSVDGRSIYVACNKADRIHEIDVESWAITRTFEAGRAPYNLEATADGRLLVATLKGGAAVEFFDLATGRSLARTPSTTTLPHGVVASPDSRFAFVTVEGVGAEPGKVDIYDLRSFERVASVEVGQQAGGIGFWKMQ